MKSKKIIFIVLPFLFGIIFYTSCKKDGKIKPLINEKTESVEKVKSVSIDANGIATIETSKGNIFTQSVLINTIKVPASKAVFNTTGDSLSIVKEISLPLPTFIQATSDKKTRINSFPSVGGGFDPFIATVTLAGGFATVTLNTTVQYSDGMQLRATVYGVRAVGNTVYWYVSYVYSQNGVTVSSSALDYSTTF